MLYEYIFYLCSHVGSQNSCNGWKRLFNKFILSLKEVVAYIMYNFRFSINEIQEVITTSLRYCLNFTNKTKSKPVDHEIVSYNK